MRAASIIVLASLMSGTVGMRAEAAPLAPATIQSCILAAANLHREPPAVLLILLNVEGGTLGAVNQNTQRHGRYRTDAGQPDLGSDGRGALARNEHSDLSGFAGQFLREC
jgi:hypothetical protein